MSAMDTFNSDPNAYNARLVEEYRANGGELSGQMAGMRLMLLTTTGAKTGLTRVAPLGFATEGGPLAGHRVCEWLTEGPGLVPQPRRQP